MSTPDEFITFYPPADATRPAWYGRKASTKPWPVPFIRAICTPRADGMSSLTPPTGLGSQARPPLEALGGLAAVALLGVFLWWALR